jgi:riboflavin kinase/FMN adenylyltransferase
LNRPIPDIPTIPCLSECDAATPLVAKGSIVCVGTFDGVHLGHQEILRAGRTHADRLGLPLWVVSFHPHPRSVVRPEMAPLLLTEPAERHALFQNFGADGVVIQRFDREVASLSANQFLTKALVGALKAKRVVIGDDFAMGKNREGDKDYIKAWGEKIQVGVTVVDMYGDGRGHKVGSGTIRKALQEGDFRQAIELLGHPYPVTGTIVGGMRKGREIGYPTWNLTLSQVKLPPPVGVYAGWTFRPTPQPGMAYYGSNPTFGGQTPHLEVNILGGSSEERSPRHPTECFWLTDFVRPEEVYHDPDDLVRQLADDEREVRRRLGV